jgi:nicotinate dehydrogenase subunit A
MTSAADSGRPTRMTVNGTLVEVALPAETPLLYVLRNDLGLKGVRFGCGLGQCGACRVIVDGTARSSCDLPLGDVAGRVITTIEGIAREGRLDPIQQAFVDLGAGQCGYCLSGIIISARALLNVEPEADEARIRDALQSNLCRCGIHDRAIRAITRAAGATRVAG